MHGVKDVTFNRKDREGLTKKVIYEKGLERNEVNPLGFLEEIFKKRKNQTKTLRWKDTLSI